ncbi:unnamed protein product (macronuclear) [Paramecium tetraurelia]|uniref:Uncharacterized protein n=1 Tax=Paramecium tetraurelia TaxID=5888 RepID=A0CK00_PARTE|nr:uncharacterized protein GSPATT00000829001 [Paramecium tetraurelia]CAK71117.1 unnamed protein product [Paramecium tetraurelia]|eukprot:XP_001438514.1 hypothetical protein (macronuclear) [Paramecium tetraurelia strain d4-2]
MNEQLYRMEKEKNNRCRLLHKVYAQKQKPPFNNMSFQIRVQNMLKQIQYAQNERVRCQSEFVNKFPSILKLNPLSRPQNMVPLNLRLNTIRTSSRQSNLIIDGTTKKSQEKRFQQASLESNLRQTSSPLRSDIKNKTSIQTLVLKDIIPVKEQHTKLDQQTQVEYNLIENISSWSRKSSESIF